jgi:hypothetical protein
MKYFTCDFAYVPSLRGQFYLRILGQLLIDRIGKIDLLSVPIGCYLEMGMPTMLGHLGAREFTVCDGGEIAMGVAGYPLLMKFSSEWDEDFLSAACARLEEFSLSVWNAFNQENRSDACSPSGPQAGREMRRLTMTLPASGRRPRGSKRPADPSDN